VVCHTAWAAGVNVDVPHFRVRCLWQSQASLTSRTPVIVNAHVREDSTAHPEDPTPSHLNYAWPPQKENCFSFSASRSGLNCSSWYAIHRSAAQISTRLTRPNRITSPVMPAHARRESGIKTRPR